MRSSTVNSTAAAAACFQPQCAKVEQLPDGGALPSPLGEADAALGDPPRAEPAEVARPLVDRDSVRLAVGREVLVPAGRVVERVAAEDRQDPAVAAALCDPGDRGGVRVLLV